MKIILTFVVLSLVSTIALAQGGNIQFSISVVANNNKPVAGISVNAMETSTLKTVNGKTNAEGKADLKLNNGKEWAVSVGEIKKCMYLLSEPDRIVATNKFFVYDLKDYKRKKTQDHNRSNAKFKVVPQTAKEDTDFKPGECMLAVTLRRPDGKVVPDVVVEAVNVKDSVVYKSKTDEKGNAFFILPNKTNYEIDVNDLKNFSYCDFGDEYTSQSLVLVFAPTVVNEKIVNDTTYQELTEVFRPSSSRSLMRIFVRGGKKNGYRERVYLRQLSTGKVFTGVTNDQGYAYFLLPVKHVYIIDFNHQKDVDAVNLTHVNDITTGQMAVTYAPDPRLEYPETFIPTPDRLLVKNFNEFLEKQFARPKDKPFSLEIKSVRRIHRQSREALFMLTLSGAEKYGNVRLPLNAAFVLDKSGSMYSNNRAEALKRSLLDIGGSLLDTDVVSVILFDNSAFEVQHTTSKHLEGLQMIAQNYAPGGGTNIFGGLERGVESVKRNFDDNKANKIILLTDGYGDNPPQDITDFVEAKFKEGIEFSTIGLGYDFNQSLLELIAQKGNGTFNYVDSSRMLSDIFLKELKSSFGYSAKDLKVDIYHNEKLIFSSLYGYPVKTQTNKNLTFEVGKVPFNTNRLAFLKFKLNNPSKEIEAAPLVVKVSYHDLQKNQPISYQQEIKLDWTDETNAEMLLDQEEKKLYAIAILNQSMKLMAEAYERKDTKEAKAALRSGRDQIDGIFPEAKPREVKALFEDVNRYLELLTQVEMNTK